ncbi:UNVERIFIED_ORG: hypothetical protein OKW14_003952 [Pantoea brenneri]|nr:hypothetical protein [Pantoea brenneri]
MILLSTPVVLMNEFTALCIGPPACSTSIEAICILFRARYEYIGFFYSSLSCLLSLFTSFAAIVCPPACNINSSVKC